MSKESALSFVTRPLRRWLRQKRSASKDYQIIDSGTAKRIACGWADPEVARRQASAFTPLLQQMHEGKPRADFAALTAAVNGTGLADPMIVEVGCGSGWNFEVLTHLLQKPVRYVGVDYAFAMAALACRHYPQASFVVGEATRLPIRNGGCEILVLGTVLMHVLGYREAIRESRRATRRWCILHTVPILQRRATTVLSKRAYGQPTVEITFNEGELKQLLQDAGLAVRNTFESIPYNLESVLGEATATRTYLCEVT